GARRNAHRAGPGGRARHCGARSRRGCLGGRRVARRSATRRRRGARGRDRGPGAARAAVHPGGGARVRRRVTLGLAALRAAALGALVLLLWNPSAARVAAGGAPPLVLLDASLSMAGHGGRWRDALDTARALAQGGIIWRFGERVAGFDTLPPTDGASRLAPALDAAAARGGPVLSRPIVLPDSGIVSTDLTLSPSQAFYRPFTGSSPTGGWQVLEVRLGGVAGDPEPRDDARLFVLEVKPQPSVVLLASPPDWETRFLARTLEDVARVPVRTFIEAEPGGSRWRDAATLESRAQSDVARAVAGAALVIEAGDPATFSRFSPKGGVLLWPGTRRLDGDWYVQPPPSGPSPLTGALAGVAWDSLPPATSLVELAPDSSTTIALAA